MEKATLEELTGYLGVGAIEMLGAFFIGDGQSNLIDWIGLLKGSQTLAIAGAVPLLVICYVLGLVTVTMVQGGMRFLVRPVITPKLFAEISTSDNDVLVRRFAEVERHSRLLYGCSGAFLVLSIGCLFEVKQVGANLAYVGYVCFALGLCVAISCIPLGHRLQLELAAWSAAVIARKPA